MSKLTKLGAKVQMLNTRVVKPMTSPGGYGQGRGGRPWRRLVEAVKVRDRCACRACGLVTLEGECDHVVPRAQGGSDHMSNAQWLCVDCHKAKTLAEMAESRGGRVIS